MILDIFDVTKNDEFCFITVKGGILQFKTSEVPMDLTKESYQVKETLAKTELSAVFDASYEFIKRS